MARLTLALERLLHVLNHVAVKPGFPLLGHRQRRPRRLEAVDDVRHQDVFGSRVAGAGVSRQRAFPLQLSQALAYGVLEPAQAVLQWAQLPSSAASSRTNASWTSP